MPENATSSPKGTWRELLKNLASLVLNRFSLAGIEYKAYKKRQLKSLMWFFVGLFALQMAFIALLFVVAYSVPASFRIQIFVFIVVLFVGIVLGAFAMVYQHCRQLLSPFSTTLSELRKDWLTFFNQQDDKD